MKFASLIALALCSVALAADSSSTFDATLLKEGRFIYRTTLAGESLGETVIEVRKAGSRYVISMSAPKVEQRWQATVDGSFAPVSATLEMRGRKGAYAMKLDYGTGHDGGKVTGEETEAGVTRPVSASLDGVVIDQRVDWAAMMAVKADRTVAVRVFDPATGSSEMKGRVGPTQPLVGAWGESLALRLDYSIRKRDHLETYTVYASAETPRYMLREEMPNDLVSELVRVEP